MGIRARAGVRSTAPSGAGAVDLGADAPPVLLLLVATEEEFDWTRPFDRAATSVRHAERLPRLQAVFDELGARPVYLCDYPIATQPAAYEPLASFARAGRAEIGAHLHPWVTPPFDEPLTRAHSFPGNLPAELERAKLAALVGAIEASFGARPSCYQAGRYGFGANTARTLVELGFEVDASPSPAFDYRDEGGPDYSDHDPRPRWHPDARDLLVVPVTGAFVGLLDGQGAALHRFATHRWIAWTRLAGALSRSRVLERMRLSPEGCETDDLKRLTRALLGRGVRVFTLTMHSPTLLPGCTPYASNERDVERFLDGCRRYVDFFVRTLGGRVMTARELRAAALQESRRVAP